MNDQERLKKATAAGRRPTTSPYESEARLAPVAKLWVAISYVFEVVIAVWLGRHDAPWPMVWGWWALICVSLLTVLVFSPMARKIKRRKMLMAREQVHRVRQLDASDPVALGLGHLFDADPELDHLSVEAGVRFALARVNTVIDEVDAATPEPSFLGHTIGDDGKVSRS